MGYSHRDRRMHRTIRRGTLLILVATVALIALAVLLPQRLLGLVAVAALALLGGAYAAHAHRLVGSYQRDVRRIRSGQPVPTSVRVEATSDFPLDRESVGPRSRSPHVRRPILGQYARDVPYPPHEGVQAPEP